MKSMFNNCLVRLNVATFNIKKELMKADSNLFKIQRSPGYFIQMKKKTLFL